MIIKDTKKLFKTNNRVLSLTTIGLISAILISGCGDDHDDFNFDPNPKDGTTIGDNPKPNTPTEFKPINLTIAHINDHHSHLATEGTQSFLIDGTTYRAERGGFARIKTVYDDLENTYGDGNFLKLHAGDAITGTSYFSFYKGDADADMMNTICFDAFALGNHEFDEGDAGLVRFLDRLHGTTNNPNNCQTPVLAANVKPAIGTPLAPSKVDDYIKPYVIKTTKEGIKVGIIGLDIKGKTKNSSRPLASTEFFDETATAQNYINELKDQGIEHIILLTHYTYDNDKELASSLSGVDVIIGGDSHTLLGDFTAFGASPEDNLGSQGDYPTIATNKDGKVVCIGQAWEYTKAIGVMDVKFDNAGNVENCGGSQIIPIANTVEKYNTTKAEFEPISTQENQTIIDKLLSSKSDLLQKDLILPYAQNAAAATLLEGYTKQIDTKMGEVIGKSVKPLCLVRVPGTTRASDIAGCEDSASQARGSDIAQVVAEAFLDGALRADFALQNAGGVRKTIKSGNVTYNDAYSLLPFGNTLVNLDITGQQVKQTLEDAIYNHLENNGSSGSHPYAAGLRWDLDLTKPRGSRISNLEVRDRATGVWSPIDMNKTYIMVTNDYIAEGRDGYTTLGPIFADKTKVEDTKLLYTQSFIDYVEKMGTIDRPKRSEYSHKTVITADGTVLKP